MNRELIQESSALDVPRESNCPGCFRDLPIRRAHPEMPAQPGARCRSVCMACGQIVVFDERGEARPATGRDLAEMFLENPLVFAEMVSSAQMAKAAAVIRHRKGRVVDEREFLIRLVASGECAFEILKPLRLDDHMAELDELDVEGLIDRLVANVSATTTKVAEVIDSGIRSAASHGIQAPALTRRLCALRNQQGDK